jgi:protein N-lysine methyltransferase METTL21A
MKCFMLTVRSLEIGAGGGVVGLAVARGCKAQHPIYISDQLEMLALMEHNVGLNGMQKEVKPIILNW